MNIYLKVLRKYADFTGRARRKEYWVFTLFNLIAALVLFALDGLLAYLFEFNFFIFSSLYFLATIVPSLAVLVRRLHDTGRSGWWFFVNFVPFVGGIVLLIFLFTDSEAGTNKWGPSLK